MSHFTVLIIGNNPEEQLAPFCENIEVERYVEATKEELIAKERKEIEDYKNGTYAEYLSNPERYESKCSGNPGHLDYVKNEFPKKLNLTDEELYQEAIDCEEIENIGDNGEIYSTYNPDSKWDWYKLGGRWTGFFKTLTGAKLQVKGSAGLMTAPAKDGHCDQTFKRYIDFEGMRKEAEDEAAKHYDFAVSIFGDTPVNETFDEIKKRLTITDDAREAYWAQPRCVAWSKKKEEMRNSWELGFFASPDDYLISREQFLQNARNSAIVTHAVLKDGKWYEKGEMGYWGVVLDEKDTWENEFNKLLDSIPDDELLSVYDCHI